MAHPIIRDKFINSIRAAVDEARGLGRLNHPGLGGQVREILAGRLIRPYIGPEVGFGTGKIIDSSGNTSNQLDIVLYVANILPPLLYDQSLGVFPIESCLYSIEVKTTLSAPQLSTAISSAAAINRFRYSQSGPMLNSALFAFDTDLVQGGKSEIERYREYDHSANQDSVIKALCVVGRGYWWFCREGTDVRWHFTTPTPNYDEVVDFIVGIANTIPDIMAQKRPPKYGYYLSDDRHISDV